MSRLPAPLVSTSWLAEHLGDDDLRILDATVLLTAPSGPDESWIVETGEEAHAAGHIPRAVYADLVSELSVPGTKFMRPDPAGFAAAVERLGVGDGTHVVAYDRGGTVWAARVWWLLRSYGFDEVAVLDGGFARWEAEGHPVTTTTPPPPPAHFTPRPRPELIADREEVLAAVHNGGACLINALDKEVFEATTTHRYARPGRIPNSLNIPASSLLDPTGRFLPLETLRTHFTPALNHPGRKITYCGGAIGAASDALALTLLGEQDVAVYDGSLAEWTEDPTLPLEVGPANPA